MNELVEKHTFEKEIDLRNPEIENVIHDIWDSKNVSQWKKDPFYYIRLGESAYKLGQVMFAYDVLIEGLHYFSENLRLNQLFSLSLIKCGYLKRARDILSGLVKKGNHDEETLGILGRVYKDMWILSGQTPSLSSELKMSRNLYFQAFRKNKGYYSGINAASLSLMLGDKQTAEKLAHIVLRICMQIVQSSSSSLYWCLATLGEGNLILGKIEDAKQYFSRAKEASTKNYSDLASTRRQVKLLSGYINIDQEFLDILEIPRIVAFTGHMIDHPERKTPRFPPELEKEIKKELFFTLESINAGIGYSSAACGSDILFVECMQERNAETNIILPFDREDFINTSVAFSGDEWVNRASRAMEKCSVIIKATDGKYLGDDVLFDYANSIIMGKALLRSALLETEPVLVTVWDGKKQAGPGGTSDFIQVWKSKNLRIETVDIYQRGSSGKRALRARKKDILKPAAREKMRGAAQFSIRRSIKALLFSDLVGFSTLKEEQIPSYIDEFLRPLAENLNNTRNTPIFRNMWGDALYFVFEDPVSAARYALELRDFVKNRDRQKGNLPGNLNIRIGLHAGPVFSAKEPVLNRINYFGTHVNQAARIEPITSPGNVYASEQFASLLTSDRNNELECKYVGIIVLPKEFGKYPIYLVKRKNEIL
jgi:class 3 adenylate cyclase